MEKSLEQFEIKPYQDRYRKQMIDVWERSVLATHHFLTPADFETIKSMVKTIDFSAFPVYCLLDADEVIGFVGVSNRELVTLFLSPDYHRQGLGKKLINFAIEELGVDKVEVNEQNTQAVEFYKNFGFVTHERKDKDNQGFDYPLLLMRRNPLPQ